MEVLGYCGRLALVRDVRTGEVRLVPVGVLTRVERESGMVGLDAAYAALVNGEL